MMFKISILNLIRSKDRTFLFTALIITLTLVLSLGVSVWVAVQQFLNDADDFYTTIALIEYIGSEYPQSNFTDEQMFKDLKSFELSFVQNDSATIEWHFPKQSYAYIDSYQRNDALIPDRRDSLLVLSNIRYVANYDSYVANVSKVLHSHVVQEQSNIRLDKSFGYFEPNNYYVVFGELLPLAGNIPYLMPCKFNLPQASDIGINVPLF